MAIPGWGGAIALVLSWVDKLVPSKKESLYDRLKTLELKYQQALEKGNDTEAAMIRKELLSLRRKAGFSDEG